MTPKHVLKSTATARLKDAEVLFNGRRYHGAYYLCGYAIELALKAKICKTLGWSTFPPVKSFDNYRSFITHRLDVLLSFTGQDKKIRTRHMADWSIIVDWNPELRYSPIGSITRKKAQEMIDSAKVIIKAL